MGGSVYCMVDLPFYGDECLLSENSFTVFVIL